MLALSMHQRALQAFLTRMLALSRGHPSGGLLLVRLDQYNQPNTTGKKDD